MANTNYSVQELHSLFDKVVKESVEKTPVQSFGDHTFYMNIFIRMFGYCPNVLTLDGEGYYLNKDVDELDLPHAEDEDIDDILEQDEEALDNIYTYKDLQVQTTLINMVEHYKDTAYIIRNDIYPTIIANDKIIFFSAYMSSLYVLQSEPELSNEMKALVSQRTDKDQTKWFYYITSSNNGFQRTSLQVKKQTIDLEANYNDDLPHDKIVDFINAKGESGLILLHGDPGTGKTTYLRNLMYECKDKTFFVLDSGVFHYITDSSFINLLLENKNAVIILEDCEEMLTTRKEGNARMSSLLNLSDGLIGDNFNFKFICTFNAKYDELDKAILRKGRMKLNYKFKALKKDKAIALAEKLGKTDFKATGDMVLTEVFNWGEDNGSDQIKENDKCIVGFH